MQAGCPIEKEITEAREAGIRLSYRGTCGTGILALKLRDKAAIDCIDLVEPGGVCVAGEDESASRLVGWVS